MEIPGALEAVCGESRVRADSGIYYMNREEVYLYGNVRYRDEGQRLESDRAVYYAQEERVRAEGNVRLTDRRDESRLTGPILHYYPKTENRVRERIYAPDRPHLTFYPGEGEPGDREPFDVDADRVHLYGDSAFAGAGRVVAVRGEMTARSDSMDLDLSVGELWLFGAPSVEAQGTTLEGDTILGLLDGNRLHEVQAWPRGRAFGEAISLRADRLRLLLEEEQIVRVVASMEPDTASRDTAVPTAAADTTRANGIAPGRRQARSESEDYVLVADSIDLLRPDGRLERLIAVGEARAEAVEAAVPGDTLYGRDWIVGDTITGFFVVSDSTVGAADEVEPELQRLVASGNARALYHLRGEADGPGSDDEPAGLNYVIGRVVTIWLDDGEAREARVIGPGTGVYLEPIRGTAPQDTATARRDTSSVPSDTTGGPEPADTAIASPVDRGAGGV